MPSRHKGSKGKRGSQKKRLWLLVAMPLLFCFVMFLVIDNFTLYWFMLNNDDEIVAARRDDDFSWYDGVTGSQVSSGGNNTGAPGYVTRYDPDDIEAAIENAMSGLSVDEIATKEFAWRCVVYAMDRRGFTPNATRGMLCYMRAEAGGGSYTMGTYTYQRLNGVTGPSGVTRDKHEGNSDWLTWLSYAGPSQVSKEAVDIGIGLVQSTDIWTKSGSSYTLSSTTHNASDMINAATAAGTFWQSPAFQVPYYVDGKFGMGSVWDLDQNPGPDPKSSSEITVAEWAGRIACGIGMPAWDSVYRASVNDEYYLNHIAHVDEATEFYNQYSGKDPLFYNEDGSLKGSYVVESGSHILSHSCSGDWRCPFCGPTYDNSTTQGLLMARIATLFAGGNIVEGDSQVHPKAHSKDDSVLMSTPTLQYYREAHLIVWPGDSYFASCDRSVSTVVQVSGVDTEFSKGGTLTQETYLRNSDKWELVGTLPNVQLQPGDVLILNSYYPNKGGTGHIKMYIGESVAGERWPGTTAQTYQGSVNGTNEPVSAARYPELSRDGSSGYRVFRCTSPDWVSDKWVSFISANEAKFPELPKGYPIELGGS